MKTGICSSIGRQPPRGLTLFSFMNAINFCCILAGSALYLSWIAFICGWSACIRFIDRVLALVNGQKIILMITVITMMATP